MSREFSDVLQDLQSDGGLRDFYIRDANRADWNAFLRRVKEESAAVSFTVDGEVRELPGAFEAIEQIRAEAAPSLSVRVADSLVCCHFFCDAEIELDFRPKDYRTPERCAALCNFFQAIVDGVGKPGIVSFENVPTDVIEEFHPRLSG